MQRLLAFPATQAIGHSSLTIQSYSIHERCIMKLEASFCHKGLVPSAGPHHGCPPRVAVEGALAGKRFTGPCSHWKDTVQGLAKGFSDNSFALGTVPTKPIYVAARTWLGPRTLDGLQHLEALPQKVLEAGSMTIPGRTIKVIDLQKANGS